MRRPILTTSVTLIIIVSVLVPATTSGAAETIHDRRYAITQLTDGGTPVGQAETDGAGEQIVFSWRPPGSDIAAVWLHNVASGEQRVLAEGNNGSFDPMISEDGKWVAFSSTSTDLTDDVDTDNVDVFLLEVATGITERITPGAGRSSSPTIDADGNAIAFWSTLTQLDDAHRAGGPSIYRWTRDGGFDLAIAGRSLAITGSPVISGTGKTIIAKSGSLSPRWQEGEPPLLASFVTLSTENPDINSSGQQWTTDLQIQFIDFSLRGGDGLLYNFGPDLLNAGSTTNSVDAQPTTVGDDNTMAYVYRGSFFPEPYELRHTGKRALGTVFQSDEILRLPSFGYSTEVLTFQSADPSIDTTPDDTTIDLYFWDGRATPSCGGSGLPWAMGDRPLEDQILRLYQATFGRSPDQGGLEFWVDQRAAGTSLTSVAAAFQDSPEWRERYGNELSDGETIALLYQNVLNRRPDRAGFDFWLSELSRGRTLADVVVSFTDSPENVEQTNTTPPQSAGQGVICRVYQAVFDRVPDSGGFDFWLSQLDGGASIIDIVGQMTSSPEWNLRYGSTSGRQLVQAIYINVLGRAPDSAGESFWAQQVFDGLPVEDLVLAFTESPENIVRTGTTP